MLSLLFFVFHNYDKQQYQILNFVTICEINRFGEIIIYGINLNSKFYDNY